MTKRQQQIKRISAYLKRNKHRLPKIAGATELSLQSLYNWMNDNEADRRQRSVDSMQAFIDEDKEAS